MPEISRRPLEEELSWKRLARVSSAKANSLETFGGLLSNTLDRSAKRRRPTCTHLVDIIKTLMLDNDLGREVSSKGHVITKDQWAAIITGHRHDPWRAREGQARRHVGRR